MALQMYTWFLSRHVAASSTGRKRIAVIENAERNHGSRSDIRRVIIVRVTRVQRGGAVIDVIEQVAAGLAPVDVARAALALDVSLGLALSARLRLETHRLHVLVSNLRALALQVSLRARHLRGGLVARHSQCSGEFFRVRC